MDDEQPDPSDLTFAERMRRRAAAAAERAKQIGEDGAERTKGAAGGVVSSASRTWEQALTAGRSFGGGILNTPERLAGLFTRECVVPAVLLPTGSGTFDFHAVFDFHEAVASLTRGILVRPRIEVWAGRNDIDRGKLATVLRDDFARQLSAARERVAEADAGGISHQITRLEQEQQGSGRGVRLASRGLAALLILMFFTANPLFNLLFLMLAVFSGTHGVSMAFQYVRTTTQLRGNRAVTQWRQKNLQAELDEKDRAFQEAVAGHLIRVHPLLAALIEDFCELDDEPFLWSRAEPPGDAPEISHHLKSAAYRRVLPGWYHPLVQGRVG